MTALKELVGEVTPISTRRPTIVRRVALTLGRTESLRHPGRSAPAKRARGRLITTAR